MELELREITPEVLDELRTHVVLPPGQAEWVGGTGDDSLDEAAENPQGNPWPRAVYRDGVPVGFVMMSWDVEPHPPELVGPWYLWKLMVAPESQGQGVGREVVRHLAALIKEQGATELLTSVARGDGTPYGFYLGLGFVPTGVYAEWDEEILALPL
jgi:ribosomal protein S18 acetylase RimI-like enzyme